MPIVTKLSLPFSGNRKTLVFRKLSQLLEYLKQVEKKYRNP